MGSAGASSGAPQIVLAFDYGTRRIGIASGDTLTRAARPLTTLQCRPDVLVRSRSTESQTTLHPAERRANVAGAFRVPPESVGTILGRHLLVVDDVWTTGATTLACADALLGTGARAVSVLTFARALPELRR